MIAIAPAAAFLSLFLAAGPAPGVESAVVSLAPRVRDCDLEKLTIDVREALAARVPGVLSTAETRARMDAPRPAPSHGTPRGQRPEDRRTTPSPCQDAGNGGTAPADGESDEAASQRSAELRAIADWLRVTRVYAVSMQGDGSWWFLTVQAYDANADVLWGEARVRLVGNGPPAGGLVAMAEDLASREAPTGRPIPGASPCGPRELDSGHMDFDEGTMTRPVKITGPDLVYTKKALDHRVQGTMVVRCVITVEGRVQRCRVLKTLPFMDRAAIDALESQRYTPVTRGGTPIEVNYNFRISLEFE